MRPIKSLPVVALLVITGLSFTFPGGSLRKNVFRGGPGFALLELFTSEGCSSCPPADEAVRRLANEFPGQVYVLGFHVDYWDYIGWKDSYGHKAFTERQRAYARVLGLESIYTPQVVVNGFREMVGSDETHLRDAILDELKKPVRAALQGEAMQAAGKLRVECRVNAGGDDWLHLALVQARAATKVLRGENRGERLEHINIVREFKTVPLRQSGRAGTLLEIPRGLEPADIKLFAFLQDRKTCRIKAAGELEIK